MKDEAIKKYTEARTEPEPELLKRLYKETHDTFGSGMIAGHVMGRFLKLLVQLTGAKEILEIGTYTGYSALSMAEGLPDNGKLITCEINPDHAEVAERYFKESPHGDKIELKMGDALDTIKALAQDGYTTDFVFLDADKIRYPVYYDYVIPLLNPGGLIVVDNALWGGEVLEPDEPEAQAIARLNKVMTEDERIENVLLTVRDGVMVGRKR